MNQELTLIIIGTGMYVSGRGTESFGTILPAVIEWKRNKPAKSLNVKLVGTNKKHSIQVIEKVSSLSRLTGVNINIEVFPKERGIDVNNYKKVIQSLNGPSCAIIAVPDHLHYKIAKTCLNKRMHTLVVKPFTPTSEQAKDLINIADDNDLYGAVEFHKRWDRANLLIKDRMNNGEIGNLLYNLTEYSQRKIIPSEIFKSWVEKTNILQYLGVHYIDLIRFLTNAVPKRVMALGQKYWLKSKGIDTYDSIQCIIDWENSTGNSFIQTILVNWIDPNTSSAMSDQKIKFIGTKGRIESDQKERGIRILKDNHPLEEPNPDFCTQFGTKKGHIYFSGYGIESVKTFLSDVCDIFDGSKQPSDFEVIRPTFKESLYSTIVLEYAAKSISNKGIWLDINYK